MNNIFFLVFRRMRWPLLVLVITYAVAMLGMVLIPGQDADGNPWHMDFFYAFYFVSFMSTTIGFGEIPFEFSDAQRIWVTLCIYVTVVVWLYSIGSLIALLQEKTLRRAFEELRFTRRVNAICEPFYLVCGYGQTGSGLVRALTDRGQRAVVLDNNPERIDLLKLDNLREFVPALRADVAQPDNLSMAGLRNPRCAGVLALTSSNEVNLKVSLSAKLIHPNIKVICRADSHDIEANMASFGTDHIYDPFDIFALYLSTALQAPCLTLLYDWLGGMHGSALTEPLYPPAKGLWVICGYGRFGKALYGHLASQDIELIVIEAKPERTGKPPGHWIKGRGTEAETLEQADIRRAVGLIAGTDNDANNLSIVMTAQQLNPRLFTVMRENRLINDELFNAVGANILMHPSLIVANRIRVLLSTPLLTEFSNYARYEDDAWACQLASRIIALVNDRVPEVWEVRIDAENAYALVQSRSQGAVPTLGDLLRDPRDRGRTLPAIVLMRRRENGRTLLPPLEDRVRDNDQLLFCGRPDAHASMGWTLQNIHALNYVLYGSSPPRGLIWRWLTEFLHAYRNRAARQGSADSGDQSNANRNVV
ncbi:MAG: potassium transporter TrkA [Thiohalocapsa sp. PB-PSB1]|jgi:voltage-gated potassium channel|nr:MAG: potassium transporter TrkA [Thiohalocapsa sp. PB-PSB1]HCS92091.1 potassium transporter TrkA [Chromatiaceae bacterium]